jgi:hypothetical protein
MPVLPWEIGAGVFFLWLAGPGANSDAAKLQHSYGLAVEACSEFQKQPLRSIGLRGAFFGP